MPVFTDRAEQIADQVRAAHCDHPTAIAMIDVQLDQAYREGFEKGMRNAARALIRNPIPNEAAQEAERAKWADHLKEDEDLNAVARWEDGRPL